MCLQEKQEKAYLPHREDKPFFHADSIPLFQKS